MQGLNNIGLKNIGFKKTGLNNIFAAQKAAVITLLLLLPLTEAYAIPFASDVINDGVTSNESSAFEHDDAANSDLFIDFNFDIQENSLTNTFNSITSVNNQANTSHITSKPEPNSLALLGLGVLSLISYRRKQN